MFDNEYSSSMDTSPLPARTECSSPAEHQMACLFPSAVEEDEEEHFPTAPLDDDVWMEEPVLDRHL